MDISIALDFSTAEIALALGKANSDEILLKASKVMSGREASSLLPWIISQIKENGHTIDDITQWTCGTGPGSFTGLRIIASLVAGLTYEKEGIDVRGVPSGNAIIDATGNEDRKSIVLYDGRRQELIGFTAKDKPMITVSSDNIDQLSDFNNICALESQRQAIEKIIPRQMLKHIHFQTEFPIEKLLLNKTLPWHNNHTGDSFFEPDLVYIRPAV